MLKKIFAKNPKTIIEEIFLPMYGEVISLSEVPDPVFAQKMMGDGIAVIPKDGKVVSPVKGQIIQVFPTKHAIGIRTKHGLEVLIHVGLDTVELNGEGYEVTVSEGQKVKIGDPIMNVDIEFIEKNNKEIVTPIIITNSAEKTEKIVVREAGEIQRGEYILKCYVVN
ncbi:PTS sugar transporter subunit IIA [Aeribacillus pallidus]|uniref:PTS sugar transporter subunit IIA n=1 Tax=Aeribacillus pallidus TaxID=33936 RepID=UPI000E346B90|nr:PTS glucose transporter subunit IIA [Aeribacillus pallidus]